MAKELVGRPAKPVGGSWFLEILVFVLPYIILVGPIPYRSEEGFAPPAPFGLVEMEANEVLPRTYSREELQSYLEYCRRKCQETIVALTNEQASRLCQFAWGELTFAELQLYNLRHVQEHGAQLQMFLGQQVDKSAKWVSQA